MKVAVKVIRTLLIVLLGLNILIWLLAHASGHNIPIKTDITFGSSAVILLGLILLFNVFIEKVINK